MTLRTTLTICIKGIVPLILFSVTSAYSANFSAPQTLELGGQNPKYVIADFNRDKFDDVAVLVPNKNGLGYDLNILTGASDPDFPINHRFKLQSPVRFMITGDFNGDNKTDLAFSLLPTAESSGNDTISVYFGRGRKFRFDYMGSHVNTPTSSTAQVKRFSAFDANNDGMDDLLVDEHVRLSAGDGTFYSDTQISTNLLGEWVRVSPTYRRYVPPTLRLGEVNGDGIIDFIVNKKSAQCGVGDGTYLACDYDVSHNSSLDTDGWADSVSDYFTDNGPILLQADFNGDGITDNANMVYNKTVSFDVSVPQPDGLPCPIIDGWRPYREPDGSYDFRWGKIYDCTPQPNKYVNVRVPSATSLEITLMGPDGMVMSQAIQKVYEMDQALIQTQITNFLVNAGRKIGRNVPYYYTDYTGITQTNVYSHLTRQSISRLLSVSGDRFSTNEYSDARIVDANRDGMMDLFIGPLSSKILELSLGDGTFKESNRVVRKSNLISSTNMGDFNGDKLLDVIRLDLPAESDHTLQLELQIPRSTAPIDPPPVDPAPVDPAPGGDVIVVSQIEIEGVLSATGSDFFVVDGLTILLVPSSIVKFEDDYGPNIKAGDPVDLKANYMSDGSYIAVKAQFGG